MSDVARLESGQVDAALGRWRNTTVERRSTWDLKHNAAVQEMLRRRRTVLAVAGVATFFTSLVLGTVLAMTTVPASGSALSTGTGASAVGIAEVGDGPFLDAPRRELDTFNAGLHSEVRAWDNEDGIWVHFDYAGSPLVLKWTDANNRAVMEPIPCVNRVSSSVRRCFVGRSTERLQGALQDEGAKAGEWTVHACREGQCAPVGTYAVTL